MDRRSQTKNAGKILLALALMMAVSLLFAGCEQPTPKQVPPQTPPEPVVVVVDDPAPDAGMQAPVDEPETESDEDGAADPEPVDLPSTKTFVLTGENFKFRLNGQAAPTLRVNVGDTVRIEFRSTDGFHDWVVDEFSAATKKVNTGGSTFVEFVVDKAGTFEYYCSVGSHRQLGMVGNLVVG